MNILPGYQLTEKLQEGVNAVIFRGYRESDKHSVLIKLPLTEPPNFKEVACLKHEYDITVHLDLKRVFNPQDFASYNHSIALIFEDLGEDFLEKFINSREIKLQDFFSIAIQLAEILEDLHKNKVIHKDIQPKNILIIPITGQIKLTGFSMASLLEREYQTLNKPELLEGTLEYMSPEQTGRMNRAIDYRTDFYSLGVTFYQILTKRVPFQAKDPMELVHSHLAKQPVPPHQLNSDIPLAVSEIVMKLLAKTAENRYQSAHGLKVDLETCLTQWQARGKIQHFILGQQDFSGQFQIPQKLYGREAEVETLLAAFERITAHTDFDMDTRINGDNLQSKIQNPKSKIELMLVSGYSGIGKSSLVHEIHKAIAQQQGYFISGKFDQFKRNIPYAPLIQAFQELIRQILTESSDQINIWKTKLLQALGSNGQVIIDIIPEVELIIGLQPAIPQLPPNESQNRFNLVFKQFIHVFTTREHPLVLFLDDLQWVDSASLKLIQLLITDPDSQYLLIIGAYRDNEVSSIHPLMLTLDNLKKTSAPINHIVLQPINKSDLNRLVADALNCPEQRATTLSEQVSQKTQGNPFFAIQFLKSLYEEGLLEYTFTSSDQEEGIGGYWQCDIAKVKALAISDNVVEFMAIQLQKLPEEVQTVVKLAACMGYQFDLATLSIVYGKSPIETANDLWKALLEGLVLPLSEIYKFFKFEDSDFSQQKLDSSWLLAPESCSYKFLHDRVQQAAYSLIPEADKKLLHWRIGQILLKNTDSEELEEKIFELVNQLNIGVDLVTNQSERNKVAELNLIAGRKAKSATAYESALKYLELGLELLTESSWENQYELTLNLYIETLEAEYLNINFERATQLSEIILTHAKTLLEKIKVYELKIPFYYSQNEVKSAIDTALQVLEMLGVTLPKKPSKLSVLKGLICTKLTVGSKRIEDLASLPEMTDPYKLAAMRLLLAIGPAAANANPTLYPLVVFKIVNLSIQYGNSSLSAYGYCMYGMLVSMMQGDIDSGYQFGQLAVRLLQNFDARAIKAKVYFLFNTFIRHWKEHVKETTESLLDAFHSGLETGDIEYACYAVNGFSQHLLWSGEPLESLVQSQTQYFDVLQKYKQEVISDFAKPWHQLVLNFLDKSPDRCRLIGELFDEDQNIPLLIETDNKSALVLTYIAKSILLYFFRDYTQSVESARLTDQYKENVIGTQYLIQHNFYYSLALLALYPTTPKSEQKQYLKKVAAQQKQMKKWAAHAPCNVQHKYELVEAETARVLGRDVKAMEYYDRAIQGARTQGYIQEEALANERAAEFYLSRGKETIADAYLRKSYASYMRWGAKAKVRDLEERYPQLRSRRFVAQIAGGEVTQATVSTIAADSRVLDLTTVFKASQALSREIVLDKLLSKLMKILIENAGAQTGILLRKKDNQLLIEAEGAVDREVALLQSTPVEASQSLPLTIINYVERTQEYVVLEDAVCEGIFAKDSYITKKQAKSILCAPLVHQGKLTGIIYLENNLTTGAFTPERLEVLKLLTAQVSISIENAELYTDLQAYSQELTKKNIQLLETNKKLENEIAERKQAEEALYRREQEFKALAENSPDIIARFDRQLRHIYVNPAIERVTGIPSSDFIGQTNQELGMSEELVSSWCASLQKVFDTACEELVEFDFLTQTGLRSYQAHIVPEHTRDGSVEFVLSVTRDITDRKRIEAEIRQLNETLEAQVAQRTAELETLFDTLPDYVFTIEREGMHILFCNYLFARSVGFENRRQVQGKTIFECFSAADVTRFAQENIQVFESGQTLHLEETIVLPDGTHHCDTIKVPLRKPNGEVYALLSTARDITELIETKQALSERTIQLETTSRELDSFSYSVSHDLRAPLRHVSGFVNALTLQLERNGAIADPKVLHYLQVIQNSSQKMGLLIDGLLTLSRLGRRQLEKHPVNLRTLVESAIALVESQSAGGNERLIEFEIGDLPTVMGDATLLQQVFSNLIDNAVKFSRDRYPARIVVGKLQDDTLFVRDNGVGFDMEYAAQLFGAFQRLHSQKDFEGTGIGLAIVQRIIHRHGGIIWAESQPEKGTTFYFTLGHSPEG